MVSLITGVKSSFDSNCNDSPHGVSETTAFDAKLPKIFQSPFGKSDDISDLRAEKVGFNITVSQGTENCIGNIIGVSSIFHPPILFSS